MNAFKFFHFFILTIMILLSYCGNAQIDISKDSAIVLLQELISFDCKNDIISKNGSSKFIESNRENFFHAIISMHSLCRFDSSSPIITIDSLYIEDQLKKIKKYKWPIKTKNNNSSFLESRQQHNSTRLFFITPPLFLSSKRDSFVMLFHSKTTNEAYTSISSYVLFFRLIENKVVPCSSQFIQREHFDHWGKGYSRTFGNPPPLPREQCH